MPESTDQAGAELGEGVVKRVVPATLKPVQDVIDICERMLQLAKEGKLREVSACGTLTGNEGYSAYYADDSIRAIGLHMYAVHALGADMRSNARDV